MYQTAFIVIFENLSFGKSIKKLCAQALLFVTGFTKGLSKCLD